MSTYTINRTKWGQLTLLEQMGNIGSEVGRSFTALSTGDEQRSEQAMIRALDLFDATAEVLLAKRNTSGLREVMRARENYLSLLLDKSSKEEKHSLEQYFTNFAIAARNRR